MENKKIVLQFITRIGYNIGNTMATKIQIASAIWIMEMIQI